MKVLAALPLAALLALGAASGAHAFWPTIGQGPDRADIVQTTEAEAGVDHPHHPCHGMTSGTHHRACGSATGGPAGGLF